ncbi:MAG: transporter substrate-binding domain-containing protein [Clostridia bacterium]|nr:transporter substrate-binding domain-containing protein [Clostridia bacterium]
MKKFLTLICAFVISLTACMGLVACGGNGGGEGDKPTPPAPAKTELTYSAMNTQYDAIDQVVGEAADIAVVEKAVFRNYYKRTYDDSIMFISGDQFAFNTEEYVMATKKGTDVADFINAALYHFQNEEITVNYTNSLGDIDCKLVDVADSFGLASDLITIKQPSISIEDVPESGSEFERILVDNFKIGFVTDVNKRELNNMPFAGNSHFAGDDGFEVLLMRAVAKAYGLTVATTNTNFVTYANREQALASGEVDVLIGGFSREGWNGDFNFTVPYLTNSQVLVIRKADASKYATFAGMKDASFTAASGTVGETLIKTGAIKTAVLG